MAFKKKGAPSAKSLDLSMNDPACSGVSPVNSKGQVTDRQGRIVDMPVTVAVHDKDAGIPGKYAINNLPSLPNGPSYKSDSYNNGMLG